LGSDEPFGIRSRFGDRAGPPASHSPPEFATTAGKTAPIAGTEFVVATTAPSDGEIWTTSGLVRVMDSSSRDHMLDQLARQTVACCRSPGVPQPLKKFAITRSPTAWKGTEVSERPWLKNPSTALPETPSVPRRGEGEL
jgi:hypothetical protein